jgi:hypothetical protein
MSYTNEIDITCFDDIIGLSRTDCTCFDENTFNISKSNLYLDELEGMDLNKINAASDCGKGSLWELMDKARSNAIMAYIGDMNAGLFQKYQLKRNPFKGAIGGSQARNTLTLGNTYAGLRIFCGDIVSGKLKITGINTYFTASGTITLWLYNNNNELLNTVIVDTQANTFKKNVLATPIELELHDDYVHNREYYLFYQYDAANKPKSNTVSCGCDGFKPIFNVDKPYCYLTQTNKRYGWSNWLMVGGVTFDTIDFDCDEIIYGNVSNYMNGLSLDVELSCDVNEVLCQDSFDFVTNPLAIATAHAIRYKAGQLLIADILGSGNVSRYTMMDGDMLQKFYVEYGNKYKERIDWSTATLDITANDCLECRDMIKLVKKGIFA